MNGAANAEPYLDTVLSIWAEQRERTSCRLSGNSMAPLIRHGDVLIVEHGSGNLHVGDIIVFRSTGTLVAHRLIRRMRTKRGKVIIVAKGDGCPNFDSPIREDRVIGKVVEVRGAGGHLQLTSRFWAFSNHLLAACSSILAKPARKPLPFGKVARLAGLSRSRILRSRLELQALFVIALCAVNRLLFTPKPVLRGTRRRGS